MSTVTFATTTLLVSLLAIAPVRGARTITILNQCDQSIWPAIFTMAGSAPSTSTGWEAAPGTSLTFAAENDWEGRIWARTKCDFTDKTKSGAEQCETGGCSDGLLCASFVSGAPASVVELTLTAVGNTTTITPDFYDVSLVDGFNLPVRVELTDGPATCPAAGCANDLLPQCPSELAVKVGGSTVACSSACRANIDGNPTNSSNCCTGSFASPSACPPNKTQFYDFFKSSCPQAYASPFDDAASLVGTCVTASIADAEYKISFCPGNTLSSGQTTTSTSSTTANGTPAPSPVTSGTSSQSAAAGNSTSTMPAASASSSHRSDTGAIAGAAVGAVGGLALIAALLFFLYRRRRRAEAAAAAVRREDQTNAISAYPTMTAHATAAVSSPVTSSSKVVLHSKTDNVAASSSSALGRGRTGSVSAPSSSGYSTWVPPSQAPHVDMPPPAYSTISRQR